MSRLTTMARFDERVPEPDISEYACALECGHDIYVGDKVIVTHDYDVVHDDCWRHYCDEMYVSRRGYVSAGGDIE